MNGLVFCAPEYPEVINGPLMFLAGPIQGAVRWQDEAIEIIRELCPQMNIASPRRLPGQGRKESGDFGQDKYNQQVDWETHHLRISGSTGAVLFWLAKEFEHDRNRAFAQTSRAELFEWKMIHQFKGLGLVVGIEEGFTGERYIRRRFGQDVPDVPILGSLVQTCKAAISVATRDWNLCQDCGQWVHSVDSCIYGEGEPGNEYRIYCETCNPGE